MVRVGIRQASGHNGPFGDLLGHPTFVGSVSGKWREGRQLPRSAALGIADPAQIDAEAR
jgi:hypothetical protein